jgi:ribonuclease HII
MLPFEALARKEGFFHIAGVDEAGRGPLAGPVVAGAVILPAGFSSGEIRDSKELSPKKREVLYDMITGSAVAWSVGVVDASTIDRINIVGGTRLAMLKAVESLAVRPHLLLIDGNLPIHSPLPERTIVRGDKFCLSIAAASILAKVTRDRIMLQLHGEYPQYAFDRHKGYPTDAHKKALRVWGPSPIHRLSFRWKK